MVVHTARELVGIGLKPKDALHVSCAIISQCDCFVTTDDQILKAGKEIDAVVVLGPVTLVQELGL